MCVCGLRMYYASSYAYMIWSPMMLHASVDSILTVPDAKLCIQVSSCPVGPHPSPRSNMVAQLAESPSSRLLKHIIRCYLRLSDNPRCNSATLMHVGFIDQSHEISHHAHVHVVAQSPCLRLCCGEASCNQRTPLISRYSGRPNETA